MSDYKSDFYDIIDEEERSAEIVSHLALPDDWKPDAKVKDACEFYRERSETVLSRLFQNIITGVDNIGKTFKDIDINAVDEKGKPIHNIAQLVSAAKNIAPLVAALKEAEKEVRKEQSALGKNNKGTRVKSTFEDGI